MGWSWHFLHHDISWACISRVMADQARIVDAKDIKHITYLTDDNAAEMAAKLKQLFG